MVKPMPIVLKESMIPIVKEPLLQEDMAPETEVTLTAAVLDVPNTEESPPKRIWL